MKTCNLSLATVVLGALAVSYSACSAQGQDNSVPGAPLGPYVANGPIGQAGSPSGSAGTIGNPPAGSSGATGHPSAGAPHFAGAPATGAGGAKANGGAPGRAGAPGATAGAPATGGAGAPATTGGCTVAAGTIADLLIDDLDDGNDAILPSGSRVGYWYTYNDGTTGAVQVPAPKDTFKGVTPGHTPASGLAATTSGPKFTSWGAGMGFDFHNVSMKSCPYNAGAYTGIKFWAKGNTGNGATMTLKAMIKTPATTPTGANSSGTCAPSTTVKCEDHFYLKPAPALPTTWTQFTMPFASIQQDGFGATGTTFDKTKLIAMQFQVAENIAFNFSIDDITFY